MGRIVIISNRLPVTISEKNGEITLKPSTGGLATGMNSLSKSYEVIWVGWPGIPGSNPPQKNTITKKLKGIGLNPVFIDRGKFNNFYGGFSNSTLWPLFHYFQQFTDFATKTWDDYKEVNELFAEATAKIARKGDIFWVQDYQLMLVPQLLRDKFPEATIGYFHHIPFPSFELMRTLPWREPLMRGVLGSDLVGFHTFDYVRHFASATSRILKYDDIYLGRIRFDNRIVDIDSFPMGIDYDKFEQAVDDPETQMEIKRYKKETEGQQIILNVDRLDYSKALAQRLKAFDLFLTKYPNYRRKVSMLVILVPSRDNVGRYKELKEEIDRQVGYINSKYGTINWTPVNYYYRAIRFSRLVAWYNLSPVALITPYRDGMNLVSKEYLACKKDGKGVLILSEMAGASKELIGALQVNPNNKEAIADAINQALQMPEKEQIERTRKMQKVLRRNDIYFWSNHFLERLNEVHKASRAIYNKHFDESSEKKLLSTYKKSKKRILFLDYDGTLANFRSDPLIASPTKKVYDILTDLTLNEKNKIVIISGRDRETLGTWFGKMDMDIVAEHGAWYKKGKGGDWKRFTDLKNNWKEDLRPIFNQFALRTPGSFLEEKNYSLAWHYRKTDPGLAEMRQHEFMEKLSQAIAGKNLQIMEGNKVLEVKNEEINKGTAAKNWLEKDLDFVLAVGDDYTDEDTFVAMPEEAFTLKVGYHDTKAKNNIPAVEDVVNLLDKLRKAK